MTLTLETFRDLRHQLINKYALWYVVSKDVPAGKVFQLKANAGYPEVWLFSLEAFALKGAELSTQCDMRDFRLWQPTKEDMEQMWKSVRG